MNNLKRFLALMLAMCMMLTAVPFGAFAADGDATHMATKPGDDTVTGEPFDTTVSKNYRIPGLVNHNGTLIASADARWDYEKDGGGMDLVVSRSTDGNTWNYTFAGYLGDNGNVWNANSTTLMDPVIISDGSTLYLLADMFPAGYSISSSSTTNVFSETVTGFDGSGNLLLSNDGRSNYGHYLKDGKILSASDNSETGYTVQGWYDLYQNGSYVTNLFFADSPFQVQPTSFICMSTSTDGGETWNAPTLVNAKPSGVSWMVLGPGSGVVTQDGNIAFTAYDNTNIYLIYGKDGTWNRVQTSAAGNESSIIELNDGTIRAFVKRAGSNTIAYVDFTKTSSGYTASGLTELSDQNYSNCMVSSLHYSKTLNGKEVVLVCCPSYYQGGVWAGRFNGKIYAYTLDDSNNMTLIGTHQINDSFFAYSNMAELADGTVGLLYEDGCINYQDNSYGGASHISYTTVDLEEELDVTFDVMTANKVNVDMYVDETVTETITGAAYNACTTEPNSAIATVTVNGTSTAYGELRDTSGTATGTRVTMADSEYTFADAGSGTWYATAVADGSTHYVAPNAKGHTANPTALTLTFNENGSVYIKDSSHYLYVNRSTLVWDRTTSNTGNFADHVVFYLYGAGEDASSPIPGYKLITANDQITPNEGYLIAFYDANNQLYVMNPTTRTTAAYNQMAAVGVEKSTTVTINGVAAGSTTAVVGDTTFKINVKSTAKDITVLVGQTVTETIENTGAEMENAEVANTAYAVVESLEKKAAATTPDLIPVTEIVSGNQYIIVNKRANGDVSGALDRENSVLTATVNNNSLHMNGPADASCTELWTINKVDGGYTVMRDGKYLSFEGVNSSMSDQENVISIALINGNWFFKDGNYYLSDMYGTGSERAHGYDVYNDSGNYWAIYEVGETPTSYNTEVTFKGVAEGTTTATVGSMTYNITVKPDVRNINVPLGGTLIDTITGSNYSTDDAAVADTSVAIVEKMESEQTGTRKDYVAVTAIESGKQYLVVNNRAGKTMTGTEQNSGMKLEGAPSADSAHVWTIAASGDNYTVRYGTDGGFLNVGSSNASLSVAPTAVKLTHNGNYWVIQNADNTNVSLNDFGNEGTKAAGYDNANSASDEGSWWNIYEIVDVPAVYDTEVTFKGVSTGTTTATVGHVTYNITVDDDSRKITMTVGQTATDTIDGAVYTMDDAAVVDPSIAVVKKVEGVTIPATKELVPVTEIVSGNQYIIVCKRSVTEGHAAYDPENSVLTATNSGNALHMNGPVSTDSTELWTITEVDGGYTVTRGDQYLTIGNETSGMVSGENVLSVNYTDNGWTIKEDGYYLSDWGGVSYENAYGYNVENDDGNYWIFYEVVDNPARSYTEVTFEGVSPGVTTATIGDVRYTITVNEDVRDITLYEGKSHTFTIENLAYTMDDVKVHPDNTYATLDSVEGTTVSNNVELIPVTEIESGKQYVLLNNRAGLTLTGKTNSPGLNMVGVAALNTPYVWTIETTGDANDAGQVNATVRYGTDGGYLTLDLGSAGLSDSPVTLQLDYQEDGDHWLINESRGWYGLHDYEQRYCAAGYSDAATDAGSWWTIYEVVYEDVSSTEVTFTGVSATTTPTTATIGGVKYNITVLPAPTEGDLADFKNIVGVDFYTDNNSSDLNMADKKITSLRISEGAFFHLGVDITDYDDVIWTTADPSIATVDDKGNVTAVKAGETTVTATVVKNGVEESITIPVTVVPSMVKGYGADDITPVFYYIEEIENTTPYYTMFLSTEDTSTWIEGHHLVEVTEGEVIWFERPIDSAFAWLWTADPDEAHALTLMTSSGSIAEYYPLKDTETGALGSGTNAEGTQYYVGNNGYNNIVSVGNDMKAYWTEKLHEVLNASITAPYGCDGAMSNTRWGAGTKWPDADRVPPLVTSMTFISDPMPHIEKDINGILPVTRLQKDFREYTNGMTATVGEYVYFQIDITLERPTVWADEAAGTGAITYSAATLLDNALSVVNESGNYVSGAYFYTKDLDKDENGTLDGVISDEDKTTIDDITDELNANWAANETVRTLSYYLIYEITAEDIDKAVIENTANLSWNYKSHYSTGSLSGAADADAAITVVGYAINDVVIDFGQRFVYTGLTADQMQHVNLGTFNTDYGTVTIEAEEDSTFTVTYTPTSILQAPDVVRLMGTYTRDGEEITRMVNSFTVYPATTVFYEEGFMFNDASTDWDTSNAQKATEEQTFELLGKTVKNGESVSIESAKVNAYGYDDCYATALGASNGSEAIATKAGASTSFTFTGTGFDLYANCTDQTGYVVVYITNAAGKVVKMYTVNTVVGQGTASGANNSTAGQTGNMYSLPIISEVGLARGTYTVRVVKSMGGEVKLDGIRVFNTVNESAASTEDTVAKSPFDIDLEDFPEFYELRDYVLHALNVSKETSEDYGDLVYKYDGGQFTLERLTSQILCDISTDAEKPAVILADSTGAYTDANEAQNLLDNGPKNELYLHAGETLVFKVETSRKMQIGLKAPKAATNYSIIYEVLGEDDQVTSTKTVAEKKALNTAVDMFYELDNPIGTAQTYRITITNTGSDILSVTDLKICDDPNAAFVALDAEDIKSTLVTMGYGVAENTSTGASYDSVAEALNAAKSGETVRLLTDCTESTVMVAAGVKLDLNGFKLTASYAVAMDGAHIIDSTGNGSLVIGEKALILDEENAMIPVYTGEGYVFTLAGFAVRQDTSYTGEGFKIQAMAYPVQMAVVDLLKDGGADNNIEIVIRLTWDTDQGTGSQDFKFTDAVVASVYGSNNGAWDSYAKMFAMVVTGSENIENLKANIIVVSGTDAEYVSSTSVNIT